MWWRIAGIVGALGVIVGAFGAHGLQEHLPEKLMEAWHTGARYHLIHALALAAVAAHPRKPVVAGGLFLVGILLFSGSLYAMALLTLSTGESWRVLGAITPLGGVCMIAGWLTLALWPTRKRPEST